MTLPLVMLGPGGDYVKRYEPNGNRLSTFSGPYQKPGGEQDMDSNDSLAAYVRYPRQDAKKKSACKHSPPSSNTPAVDTVEISNTNEISSTDRDWVRAGSLNAIANAVDAWLARQQITLKAASNMMMHIADSSRSIPETEDAQSIPNPQMDIAIAPHATIRRITINGKQFPVAPLKAASTVLADIAADRINDRPVELRLDRDLPVLDSTFDLSQDNPSLMTTELNDEPQTHTQAETNSRIRSGLAVDQGLFPDLAGTRRRNGRQQSHGVRTRRSTHQKGCAGQRSAQGTLFGVGA